MRFRPSRAAAAAALWLAASGAGSAHAFDGWQAVDDSTLAEMRGGILLPNGLDLAVGIEIETAVDGVLVLRTALSTEDNPIQPRVFTGGASGIPSSGAGPDGQPIRVASGGSTMPTVTFDRSGVGPTVSISSGGAVNPIAITTGELPAPQSTPGQTELAVVANGPPIATEFGQVTLQQDARGVTLALDGADTDVTHLIGAATGAIVANMANDRVIDTVTWINVDIGNAAPLIAGAMLGLEAVGLDAAGRDLY